jgi:hypothetical protein
MNVNCKAVGNGRFFTVDRIAVEKIVGHGVNPSCSGEVFEVTQLRDGKVVKQGRVCLIKQGKDRPYRELEVDGRWSPGAEGDWCDGDHLCILLPSMGGQKVVVRSIKFNRHGDGRYFNFATQDIEAALGHGFNPEVGGEAGGGGEWYFVQQFRGPKLVREGRAHLWGANSRASMSEAKICADCHGRWSPFSASVPGQWNHGDCFRICLLDGISELQNEAPSSKSSSELLSALLQRAHLPQKSISASATLDRSFANECSAGGSAGGSTGSVRFRSKVVRDLLWSMASPSIISSAHLGNDVEGWCSSVVAKSYEWLDALDRDPSPLHAWLSMQSKKGIEVSSPLGALLDIAS